MRRREFMALLGGAAATWPLAARAQQPSMPVLGFLHSASAGPFASYVAAFHQGLNETGFVSGKNVMIEYRWAEGKSDQLPALVAELVQLPVAVLVAAGGSLSALTAKRATTTIPIVFPGVDDPVKLGIVQSFNRPGGNATGVSLFNAVLATKRLDLLRQLIPKATAIAFLVNPRNPSTEAQVSDVEEAARASGQNVQLLSASTERDIDTGFATLAGQRADALVVGADPLFQNLRNQLTALTARHALPAIYLNREFPIVGGLISYGIHFPDAYRQAGNYAGRILKGEKPSDLPIVQPTKFELVINLKTAKALGLTVPDKLLVAADEVIE
jgi:putative tryptophan/tyrosine transport system substrate-binding protein